MIERLSLTLERRGLGTGPRWGVVRGQRRGQDRILKGPARREEEPGGGIEEEEGVEDREQTVGLTSCGSPLGCHIRPSP